MRRRASNVRPFVQQTITKGKRMKAKPKMTWVEWLFFIILFAFILTTHTGCATDSEMLAHRDSLAAWERVETARAQASARRFEALGEVARRGDTAAQVAVAFAIAGSGGGGSNVGTSTPMPAPPDSEARAYRWASLVLPTATTITAGYFGYKLGSVQSDNARMQAEASYGAMANLGTAGIAGATSVAVRGFDAFAALPPGTVTTTTLNVGPGGVANTGSGSAMLDNSRRCNPVYTQTGGGTTSAIAGSGTTTGGGATAYPPTWNFSNPFTC
jgi:hypothetical protein